MNFWIKNTLLILAISVVVHSFGITLATLKPIFDKDFISYFADIVTIVGIIGLWIAYQDYKGKEKEKRENGLRRILDSINSIKPQLKIIGNWVGYSNGGYHESNRTAWKSSEFNKRGDPMQWVFDIENQSLREVPYIPVTENLDINLLDINEDISFLNQWISSFNSTLREIREFKYSRDADKNVVLHNKLSSGQTLSADETAFCQVLVNMYAVLHFDIIGDEETETMFFWYKKLIECMDEVQIAVGKSLKTI